MKAERWSSYATWFALAVLLSLQYNTANAYSNTHQPRNLHPSAPADIVARQPQATTPPPALARSGHQHGAHRRSPNPDPVATSSPKRRIVQSRLSSQGQHAVARQLQQDPMQPRLILPIGGDDTSSSAAAASSSSAAAEASSSSAAAASSSAAAAASLSSSIQASITSSIQASMTSAALASSSSAAAASAAAAAAAAASASSSRAALASSRSAAEAASSLSASVLASISSALAASASSSPVVITSTQTAAPTASADSSNTDNDNDSHTSLIIGVSVVGGAALLGLAAFLYMKFGSKSNHYDEDDADIKWPELRSEGDAAAMHPLPARRTGGAGFEMAGESDTGHDRDMVEHADPQYGRESFSGSTTAFGAAAGGAGGYGAYGAARGGAGVYDDGASAAGYGAHAGYYDQYGGAAPSYTDVANPYTDVHSPAGYPPATGQGYYDGTGDTHAAAGGQGMYGQADPYQQQQHAMQSPPMQATHAGYGGRM